MSQKAMLLGHPLYFAKKQPFTLARLFFNIKSSFGECTLDKVKTFLMNHANFIDNHANSRKNHANLAWNHANLPNNHAISKTPVTIENLLDIESHQFT